uniref:Phospholipase D n=1 Tax=Kalanchoe fedtschenkoi TaxID=63787 RepID=A0A7N0V3U6_KALFE
MISKEKMKKESPQKETLLHGNLDLQIIEARSLPNMDLLTEHIRRFFTAFDSCGAHDTEKKLRRRRKIITSDPYVTVNLNEATVARTRVISNSQNPCWNEHFKIPIAHSATHIEFHVKDNDVFGAEMIGVAAVPADLVMSGEPISDWFPVIGQNGKPHKPDSALRIHMRFVPCGNDPFYKYGMSANPESFGVRDSYFPVRRGSSVTLYQDAHVAEGDLPEIELDDGQVFNHDSCWEDICHAILEAHHLVYIVGWSIFHKVRLVREPTKPLPSGGNLTLGELLKYKSQEGVRVLLLVWDDKTSHNKFFIKTDGVMQTHDEETKKFFKHSSVSCVLAPRYPSSKLSIFKQQVVGTLFTHHQKCVLVDSQAHGNNRKLTCFLGGLDLCDGRYDTPDHRLFHDLDTVFQDDYHNPTIASKKGPRQPWHDWHCKIEGPAAHDVMINFEQRWKKATRWSEVGTRLKRITHWHDDALIKLERISWILSPSKSIRPDDPMLWVFDEDNNDNWHVQVFRSIDSGSVKGFPKDIQTAEAQNLVCAKNLVIDKSIQTAYIEAIRSAQHFIYIENQYFIGSSYAWPSYQDTGAENLIPIELALKIASKIRAGERFAVYVVIPMWPEGNPSSASVQDILLWQAQTMRMMYDIVAKVLKEMNMKNSHPQDYLNFYCLGNREKMPEETSESGEAPSTNFDSVSFQ